MKTDKKKFSSIRLITGLVILFSLFYWIDFSEVWKILSQTEWQVLLILFIIFITDRLFMAFKWGILLKKFNPEIKLSVLAKAYLYSAFVGQFIPVSISGDIIRYFKIKSESVSGSNIFTSIIIEKLFGTLALLSVVFISMLLIRNDVIKFPGFKSLVEITSILLILLLLLFAFAVKRDLLKYFSEMLPVKFAGKVSKVTKAFNNYFDNKNILVLFFIFCLLEQIFPIFADFLFARSLNIDISFLQMSFVVSTTLLFARLPISPSSIGFQEGVLVGLFMLLGFTKEQGLAVGIGTRILGMIFTLPIPIVFFNDIFSSISGAKKELNNNKDSKFTI